MYITISPQKSGGNYPVSVADYVQYLEKENEGLPIGKQTFFFNQQENRVPWQQVVEAIDGNTAKLSRKEPRFYAITISPSQAELKALTNPAVDLKAYTPEYYKNLCGARLTPVKETLIRMKSMGIFVEVTTLIVPELNDDRRQLEKLATFLVDKLGPETPWHISRFHPTYKLTNHPPTPLNTLVKARDIGLKAGLRYVYTGNVPGQDSENTFCFSCGKRLIERLGFQIQRYEIENNRCRYCDTKIDGVGL